jgi:MerR family copper efflux transcriptional regulator
MPRHTDNSADVKVLALSHVKEMEQRIRDMQEMRDALLGLAERCHGDQEPECPILDSLACHSSAACEKLLR